MNSCGCRRVDHLAIADIEHAEDAHDLAVAGTDLQLFRAPAHIRAQRDDGAAMRSAGPSGGMALQRKAVMLHDPEHPLGIDRRLPLRPKAAVQQRRDPPATIVRPGVDDGTDWRQEFSILGLAIRTPRLHRPAASLVDAGTSDVRRLRSP